MPTLAQLLSAHRRLLVLDAASTATQAGLLGADGDSHWHASSDEAGIAVFSGVDAVLRAAGGELAAVDAFVFCEGPGSILSVRTTAMALRTWLVLQQRPVFAYQSLALAAVGSWAQSRRGVTVIADARRETWHCQSIDSAGKLGALERRAAGDLPPGELATPENFRAWAPLPGPAATCRYRLAELFPLAADADLFRATDAPDAFAHAAPEYKKWTAQVHQAPAPSSR